MISPELHAVLSSDRNTIISTVTEERLNYIESERVRQILLVDQEPTYASLARQIRDLETTSLTERALWDKQLAIASAFLYHLKTNSVLPGFP